MNFDPPELLPRSQNSRQSNRNGAPKLIKLFVILVIKLLGFFPPVDLRREVDECRLRLCECDEVVVVVAGCEPPYNSV